LTIVWDGSVGVDVHDGAAAEVRHRLADAAKRYDWPEVIALLREHPDLVNTTRPGGASLFAPLHQAAHGGAPVKVSEELVRLGAWRTLQNANGERPVDIAERRGNGKLAAILEPILKRHVPIGVLLKIQRRFHEVILERAAEQIRAEPARVPRRRFCLSATRPSA
jgi:hypothetical protein